MIDSGVSDAPIEGYSFTWFNSLGRPRVVEERLDRALANTTYSTELDMNLVIKLIFYKIICNPLVVIRDLASNISLALFFSTSIPLLYMHQVLW